MSNAELLYHGSMYAQEELMPGFKRSGELVEWDHTESNKFLYATTERDVALMQGFASAVEKTWPVERFLTRGIRMTVYIVSDKFPSTREIEALTIYLYTLKLNAADGWKRNSNKFNGLNSEWKTEQTIKESILSREQLDVGQWLRHRRLEFVLIKDPSEAVGVDIRHQQLRKYLFG